MKSLLVTCALFGMCQDRGIPLPGGNLPSPPAGAAGPFEHIAYWGSFAAGLAFIAGIILLWSNPKKGQQILVMALSVLIGCQVMIFIAAHLFWIGLITMLGGLAYVGYRHRDEIEDMFDGETEKIENPNDD